MPLHFLKPLLKCAVLLNNIIDGLSNLNALCGLNKFDFLLVGPFHIKFDVVIEQKYSLQLNRIFLL